MTKINSNTVEGPKLIQILLKDLELKPGLWKCGNMRYLFFLLYCGKISLKHFYFFRFSLHSLDSSSYHSDIHTDSILNTYCYYPDTVIDSVIKLML